MKVGDRLAKTLYTDKNRILLRAGNHLSEAAIRNIKELGYKGIYIENELSEKREDITVPEPLISDFESMQVVSLMKDIVSRTNIVNDQNDPMFFTFRKKLEEYVRGFVDVFYEMEEKNELLLEVEDSRTHGTWLFYHSLNTCLLSIGIAIKLGLPKETTYEIAMGAVFHDVGKMFVPRELVEKINPTKQELEQIREHATKGFRLFQRHGYPVNTTYAIWFHHEREDGSGYPNGVKSDKIPLTAKIVSLASSYDNMVNYNPFNTNPLSQKEALEKIYGDAKFNNDCIIALNQFAVPYPVGTKVKLSNGKEGLVIKNTPGQPLRPMILSGRAEVLKLASDSSLLNVVIE